MEQSDTNRVVWKWSNTQAEGGGTSTKSKVSAKLTSCVDTSRCNLTEELVEGPFATVFTQKRRCSFGYTPKRHQKYTEKTRDQSEPEVKLQRSNMQIELCERSSVEQDFDNQIDFESIEDFK
jgi:hypothetical protein